LEADAIRKRKQPEAAAKTAASKASEPVEDKGSAAPAAEGMNE